MAAVKRRRWWKKAAYWLQWAWDVDGTSGLPSPLEEDSLEDSEPPGALTGPGTRTEAVALGGGVPSWGRGLVRRVSGPPASLGWMTWMLKGRSGKRKGGQGDRRGGGEEGETGGEAELAGDAGPVEVEGGGDGGGDGAGARDPRHLYH